jgi:hypothetical protein
MSKALVALVLVLLGLFNFAHADAGLGIALTVGRWLFDARGEKAFYIKVEGTGSTEREAQLSGFSTAIDQAVGTLILSERESNKNGLVRNDILNYSSGVVQRFEVLDRKNVGSEVTLTMDVWVSESEIVKRVKTITVSKTNGTIDSEQMHRDYLNRKALEDTDNIRKDNAIAIFNNLMRDYPRNVFDIEVGKTSLTYGSSVTVDIPITLKFSKQYINALVEILKKTRDGNGVDTCLGIYWICGDTFNSFGVRNGMFGPFSEETGYYKNNTIPQTVVNSFERKPLWVKMTFVGPTKMETACWDLTGILKNQMYKTEYVWSHQGVNTYTLRYWTLLARNNVNHHLWLNNSYGMTNEQFIQSMPKNIEFTVASDCK